MCATLYLTSSRGGVLTAAVGLLVFVALCRERLRAVISLSVLGAGALGVVAVLSARSDLADGRLQAAGLAAQGRSAAVLIAGICLLTGAVHWLISRASLPTLHMRVPRPLLIAGALALVSMAVIAAHPAERFEAFKDPPRNPFVSVEDSSDTSDTAATPRHAPTSSHLLSSGGHGRWQFWGAAVDEFQTRPLTGRGPGSYEAWWAEHGAISYFTRHAHSLYLETLGELGLVGLLLLVGFLVAGLVAGLGRLRGADPEQRNLIAALAAVAIAFSVAAAIDWVWQLTVIPLVAIVALALLAGPATLPGTASHARDRRLMPVAVRVGVVATALCLLAAQAIPLLAQDDIRRSQHRFAAGNLAGARDAALSARSVQPWAATPHLQLALVEERRGELAAARSAIAQAIERDRLDWRLWLTASRIEGQAGFDRQARASLDRAAALNPRSPLLARIAGSEER